MLNNNTTQTLNIPKSINFLSTELKSHNQELVRLKSLLLNTKSNYKIKISEYNNILSLIINQESEIEALNSKISKHMEKMQLYLYQLSSKSYLLNLKDSSHNPECFKLINLMFLFCCPHQREEEFDYSIYLCLVPKESDFRELLEYAVTIQKNLYNESRDCFNSIKSAISKEQIIQYPFNVLFEYFNHIYSVISLEEEIKGQLDDHDVDNNKKNIIFTEIKTLEKEIMANDYLYKKNERYVNEINSLLTNYKAINGSGKNNNKLYKEFIQSLKDFQPISESRSGINKHYVTTLSINSDINSSNMQMNGDNHSLEFSINQKRPKNSIQNSIQSNNNSFCNSTNKKFLSSFAEILPDQPEVEIHKLISLIKGGKTLEDRNKSNNHCSTIETQKDMIDDDDIAAKNIEYGKYENKESICDELPTRPSQIFSIRTTTIGNNTHLITSKETMKLKNEISRNRAIL